MCPFDLFDVTYCLLTVPVNATRQAVGDNERIHARIVALGSTAVSFKHVSIKKVLLEPF